MIIIAPIVIVVLLILYLRIATKEAEEEEQEVVNEHREEIKKGKRTSTGVSVGKLATDENNRLLYSKYNYKDVQQDRSDVCTDTGDIPQYTEVEFKANHTTERVEVYCQGSLIGLLPDNRLTGMFFDFERLKYDRSPLGYTSLIDDEEDEVYISFAWYTPIDSQMMEESILTNLIGVIGQEQFGNRREENFTSVEPFEELYLAYDEGNGRFTVYVDSNYIYAIGDIPKRLSTKIYNEYGDDDSSYTAYAEKVEWDDDADRPEYQVRILFI